MKCRKFTIRDWMWTNLAVDNNKQVRTSTGSAVPGEVGTTIDHITNAIGTRVASSV